jgi:hypothetical protein
MVQTTEFFNTYNTTFFSFLYRFSHIKTFLEKFSNTHIEVLVESLRMSVKSELINCSNNLGFLLFIGLLN